MDPPWTPPDEERALGLGFYATRTPGIGGEIKDAPESFRVREISLFPRPDPAGPFTVLRVVSRNWEQHELSERLARRLGLSPRSIDWAGTKDRRAIAERLASYRGPMPSEDPGIPGVEIVEAYAARDGLVLGHHFGNAFEIRVSAAPHGADRIPPSIEALRAAGGVPNLFGPQRFGEVRPITHAVGAALVRGDVAGAVDRYLIATVEGGEHRGDAARRAFAEHHDPQRALREFPPEFRFERQMLDHLARGHDAPRAFRALSHDLRTLFVHAYQAWIFNRLLERRHREGVAFDRPTPGDHLLRVARDGTVPGKGAVAVEPDNLPEALDAVARGRAVVAAPLVGHSTPSTPGRPGEWLEELLASEGIDRGAFAIPTAPELASAGTFRPVQVPVPPIGWSPDLPSGSDRPPSDPPDAWWFRFALPKGSYATVLLREIRKSGASLAAEEPFARVEPLASKRAF